MIKQRYKVVAAVKMSRRSLTPGSQHLGEVLGMDVRAEPIPGPEMAQMAGIYPHTPGGTIAFETFAPDAARLQPGAEFTLTIEVG